MSGLPDVFPPKTFIYPHLIVYSLVLCDFVDSPR